MGDDNVLIFIASSVEEFKDARQQIADALDIINQAHEEDGVHLIWRRPESMSMRLRKGGAQLSYDDEIRKSRVFVLLIGEKLGKYTEGEFNLALELFQETGKPLIFPFFLNVRADMNVLAFEERLRKDLPIGEQYPLTYASLDSILFRLHIELIRSGIFRRNRAASSEATGGSVTASGATGGSAASSEATRLALTPSSAELALYEPSSVKQLIRAQQSVIAELDKQPVTPLTIAKKTVAYEEIRRLVRERNAEPDALFAYMEFLWNEHQYDTGMELGSLLKGVHTQSGEETVSKEKTARPVHSFAEETASKEETARRGQDAARELVQEQLDKIEQLKAQAASSKILAKMADAYQEIRRLVQTYKVAPDALLDYLGFLYDQHQYNAGIEVGHWLENYYHSVDNPDDYTLVRLKNFLGLCYNGINQHEQAEWYYQEIKRLIEGGKSDTLDEIIYNNLNNQVETGNNLLFHTESLSPFKKSPPDADRAQQVCKKSPYCADKAKQVFDALAKL